MPIGKIAFRAAAMVVAATHFADARPDTRKMTCAQTQALIESQHAAVLSTGPSTYDRYVRQFGNECDAPYVPMVDYVPASDGRCMVYRARSRRQWFRIDRRLPRRSASAASHVTFLISGPVGWSVAGAGVQSCPLHSKAGSSFGGRQFCPTQCTGGCCCAASPFDWMG
ncbi:hypothetical protein [Mesorhizobium argentiipisi]|uniref:hypothetical protein n=1 Tax=Mesorhizobium argentiipisi TaxID=3015175 RepID=UPI00301CED0D